MQAADPPYPGGREPQEPAAVAEIFIFENAAGLLACSGRVCDLAARHRTTDFSAIFLVIEQRTLPDRGVRVIQSALARREPAARGSTVAKGLTHYQECVGPPCSV
jgi:hypothetical protein